MRKDEFSVRGSQLFGSRNRFFHVNIRLIYISLAVWSLAVFLAPGTAHAQGMVSPVFMTDFEAGQTFAREQKVPLLLIFSGSDWCKPCALLDQNVWQTEEFIRLAEEKLVVVRADFPRKKKNQPAPAVMEQNESLASRYNPQGEFPKLVLFSSDGSVLGHPRTLLKNTAELDQEIQRILDENESGSLDPANPD